MAAHRHPCVGDLTYGADPTLAKRLRPDPAVAARRAARLRAPRRTASGCEFASDYPEDLQQALDQVREETYG